MERVVYKNALVDGSYVDLVICGGRFEHIGKTELAGTDLGGLEVFPGLVDIHTHGCMGLDTMDGRLAEMSVTHARNGVTSWLPTTMTAPIEWIDKITSTDISNIEGANILGFHLEGPYIAGKYKGAQNAEWIKNPDYDEFSKIKNVKLVTVAPELDGCMDFIKKCDCVVSIGHTESDYDTAIAAIEAGANCITHTFNAMPPLHHRKPAVLGAAFMKHIYAQVICDGLHIHKSVIMMLYTLFGADRMILISDSMRATGLGDGVYDLGGQTVYVKDGQARLESGTLAGSSATLLDCVKHAIDFGIPKKDAFKMATQTPSELIGANKGRIEVGYDADFIALDENLELVKIVIGGKPFTK